MDREISNEFQKILSKQGINQDGIESRVPEDKGKSVLISTQMLRIQKKL